MTLNHNYVCFSGVGGIAGNTKLKAVSMDFSNCYVENFYTLC